MLKREMYLRQIRPFYDSDIIKVITGVRRAGKSVILESIRDELAERKISADQMIYINLEDLEYSYILNAKDLNNEIKGRIKGNAKYYIFLMKYSIYKILRRLASFMATLNVSLFVTGSCSTLLSGELATLLTGRTVEFEILPFSFREMKEFFTANGRGWADDHEMFLNYLKWGGFPQDLTTTVKQL